MTADMTVGSDRRNSKRSMNMMLSGQHLHGSVKRRRLRRETTICARYVSEDCMAAGHG